MEVTRQSLGACEQLLPHAIFEYPAQERMYFFSTWRFNSLKIVVAGGAGFIGSHLCTRLLDEGHDVLCIDNFITGSERNIEPLRNHAHFAFLHQDVTQPF